MSNRTLTYTIKLLSDIARQANADAQAVESTNRRQSAAYQKMARDADRASQQAQRAQTQMQHAAEKTNQSINKLASTSVGARMARQLEPAIIKLKQMQSLAEKTGGVLGKVGKGVAIGAGGAVAGSVAAAAMLQKPVDYEKTVARTAITADKGRTVEGFTQVKNDIEQGIRAAIDVKTGGGGARDGAASALDNMVASGQGLKSAIASLPAIMKSSTASGAEPIDLSNIVIKGKKMATSKMGKKARF